MATSTITPRPGIFPEGTAVGLYKRTDVDVERDRSVPPLAAPVTTGVISGGKFQTTATLGAIDFVLIGFVDEVQSVKVDATGGQFKLTFEGQQTSNIAYNATAAKVREELEALNNIAPGDVEVTGGTGGSGGANPYVVKFLGAWAGTNVAQMTGANGTSPLSGGGAAITITTTTEGSKAGDGGVQRDYLWSNKS